MSRSKMVKILIVDDDLSDLDVMTELLENEDHEVVKATNGAEAFDLLSGNGFSLILLDIRMPTLSGYDLLRLLREKINHNCPIVYVSIVPKEDVDMQDCEGFIQKPFSPEEFINKVNDVIKNFKKK